VEELSWLALTCSATAAQISREIVRLPGLGHPRQLGREADRDARGDRHLLVCIHIHYFVCRLRQKENRELNNRDVECREKSFSTTSATSPRSSRGSSNAKASSSAFMRERICRPTSSKPPGESASTTRVESASPPMPLTSSVGGLLTGAERSSGRSGNAETGSTNGAAPSSSRSTTRQIRYERLSPRGTAVMRQIMTRVILDGLTPTEIGYELGTSRRWVSQQIDELRAEIERLN
jgi:hypothetical protein